MSCLSSSTETPLHPDSASKPSPCMGFTSYTSRARGILGVTRLRGRASYAWRGAGAACGCVHTRARASKKMNVSRKLSVGGLKNKGS